MKQRRQYAFVSLSYLKFILNSQSKWQPRNPNQKLIYDFLLLFCFVVQESSFLVPHRSFFTWKSPKKRSTSQITAHFVVQMFLHIFFFRIAKNSLCVHQNTVLEFLSFAQLHVYIQTVSNVKTKSVRVLF